MKDTPINYEVVKRKIEESKIPNLGNASIREIKRLINEIECETGDQLYPHGNGSSRASCCTAIGIEAEIKALKSGVAAIYPEIDGLPELKIETSRFVKLFLDVEVTSRKLRSYRRLYAGRLCGIYDSQQDV